MGAPWVGSLSLLGLKGPLGLRGPLGLLDPRASLDPWASWHPREPRGHCLMTGGVALRIYNPFGVAEGFLIDST